MARNQPGKSGRIGCAVLKTATAIWAVFLLTGCGAVMRSVTTGLADDLSAAILNNSDLETVAAGTPAYLIMIDGLMVRDPHNSSLLTAASKLYSQYASAFVSDPVRGKLLADKALFYAWQAVCLERGGACDLKMAEFKSFSDAVDRMGKKEVPLLYTLGAAWATSIQFRKDDWEAIAEIPRVQKIMQRVADLSEAYENGGAHLYLGVFASLIPPSTGGKPEQGKAHFERALSLGGEKNLMIYVLYAQYYARLVFDRDLHDRLLTRALEKNPDVPGYVLVNAVAQKQARALLESANGYF